MKGISVLHFYAENQAECWKSMSFLTSEIPMCHENSKFHE
jgi:hypothetical protein